MSATRSANGVGRRGRCEARRIQDQRIAKRSSRICLIWLKLTAQSRTKHNAATKSDISAPELVFGGTPEPLAGTPGRPISTRSKPKLKVQFQFCHRPLSIRPSGRLLLPTMAPGCTGQDPVKASTILGPKLRFRQGFRGRATPFRVPGRPRTRLCGAAQAPAICGAPETVHNRVVYLRPDRHSMAPAVHQH